MASTADPVARKQARLAVRLTPGQDALIRDAAASTGQSLTDFVTAAAVAMAEDTLADRRVFRLDAMAWKEFVAVLDGPARPIPELASLLADLPPWEEG